MNNQMKIAQVNDPKEAKLFFDEFRIPYKRITEGKDKGKLLVRRLNAEEQYQIHIAQDRLRKSRLHRIIDHENAFLDKDNNVIVTFSPYDVDELPPRRSWLQMSDHSIYGNGTKTFVVRITREEIILQQIAELNQKIQEAEERVLHMKVQYDKEVEKLNRELEKLDELIREKETGRHNQLS